jgi:cell division transport system permease protein
MIMAKKTDSFLNMQFITSSISTMLVLLLLGMVVFFVLSANNLSTYVRENISFTVLVSDDMKEPEVLKFQKKLNEKVYVKESVYISKEKALQEQTEAMGTDPAEFLGYNPFTASIEIKLNAAYANSDSIAWIEKEITSNKKVMEVSYPQDLLDSVNRNIRKVSMFLLGLAALLTLISFALINNTIRLAIYSKRFLIHTMKLVGASWGFIRRPFLLRNIWIGAISGVMADAVLMGMAYMLVKYEPQLIEIMTPASLLVVMVSVFIFGLAITSLCAYISINKYLRMKASALYYI